MPALRGVRSRLSIPAACAALAALASAADAQPSLLRFEATAYTQPGVTASGTATHEGIVAADPDVLPLGSRIRVRGTGGHDGVYVVRDTGPKIQGRKLDLYIADDAEAKAFGRKQVKVQVLRRGDGQVQQVGR